MQEMFSKLSSYAALLGVIGAIGGGFMAWGEFNNRIAQLENKEFVVNETVDLSGCLLYTSPSPRDRTRSRMPSSA